MLQFICYAGCSTCAKARKWLVQNGISFEERDIAADRPRMEELRAWQKRSGLSWKRLFNSSGRKYRELRLKDRLSLMEEEEILALLASDGMLVKRPLLVGDDFVLVGFGEDEWANTLKGESE